MLRERNQRGFADLASLLDYLYTELGGDSEEGSFCDDGDEGNGASITRKSPAERR